jgi:hypothetical protein
MRLFDIEPPIVKNVINTSFFFLLQWRSATPSGFQRLNFASSVFPPPATLAMRPDHET